MSKYEPLGRYLQKRDRQTIRMSFEEIEDVLGFDLPMYLRTHNACWYGTAEGSPTHVAKHVWQAAGYKVSTIDLVSQYVVFEKM